MMKDMPNHFYHYPERTVLVWEGMKTQEYKRTPATIKRGDPVGIVVPVLLPKQFTLEELKPRG